MHGTGGSIALIDGKLVRVEEPTRHAGTDTHQGAVATAGAEMSAPAADGKPPKTAKLSATEQPAQEK